MTCYSKGGCVPTEYVSCSDCPDNKPPDGLMEWIRVKDKTPAPGVKVVAVRFSGRIWRWASLATVDDVGKWYDASYSGCGEEINTPTHWAHLPGGKP